jgi:hypothetical protein
VVLVEPDRLRGGPAQPRVEDLDEGREGHLKVGWRSMNRLTAPAKNHDADGDDDGGRHDGAPLHEPDGRDHRVEREGDAEKRGPHDRARQRGPYAGRFMSHVTLELLVHLVGALAGEDERPGVIIASDRPPRMMSSAARAGALWMVYPSRLTYTISQ